MNGVGIWKIKSNRVNYGIMLAALLGSYLYSAFEYEPNYMAFKEGGVFRRLFPTSPSIKNYVVEPIALASFWVVALFNFTKVLMPVFSKWVDSMEKKLKK
jgi:hypothetical protein